ncbi:hypothetical protein [Mesorhizobium sp. B2-4-12]|uniref:hypothetical protein n=1 Tax=Mesorhizobium sp. B2-4-12 TaxID=2589937 RepID=UPI001FEEE436|nr:hypothetical protein [Mesorhizobium sp. B2-4-12]
MELGYLPNPAAPVRYNELVLWRKIVDRNPLFVTLTDKLAAKVYIRDACPGIAMPETLWCGRDAANIPPGLLTSAAVIKANHGCAMNIFVSEGGPDRAAIVRKARRWQRERYGRRHGEWAYRPIVPGKPIRCPGGIRIIPTKTRPCPSMRGCSTMSARRSR